MGSKKAETGASLVEFAVLLPLLVTLLMGIIEFGWLFSQHIDVRHGAREGARLAATDYGTATSIINETCDRMDIAGSSTVEVQLGQSGTTIGSVITVTVRSTPTSLTGLFNAIMPAHLQSSIETRMEQTAGWSAAGFTACP